MVKAKGALLHQEGPRPLRSQGSRQEVKHHPQMTSFWSKVTRLVRSKAQRH